ncbi:DUF255 domain-containing protein [Synoicihabitans lomoniglobus]|uniref:DUF255 domain-containing protein n=1 Tax=Synoicihabitans lomoniglobus TaxID=2909285 RepID=A0AAE9ZRC7_9BACT|nr:DUF255 domain-containing protein [Opitutaceae bacterium LMO-M01]WED63825.1 DUF255 domain-containing protein [Opitutaceae bacterium LMO-M01]
MPKARSLFAPLLLLCFALTCTAEIPWLDSVDAGQAAAAKRDLPLYIAVSDPLNELDGAMHRQTFANAEVAAFLQANFVCVLVNRDAAPGLAAYGQQWLAADQKIAGWPLNLWFTPELQPIEGASYLPPTEEWGREGFMVVAGRVAERWTADAGAVRRGAENTQRLIADYLPFAAEPVDDLADALRLAAEDWIAIAQPETGTFGDAPHRLEPELIRFLIARGGETRAVALAALRTRLTSALRDPLDGGFYRATADGAGGIPVFQKRLTDQARIALACLDAAAVDDDPLFAAGARSALQYVINRLSPSDGTFYIGDDATESSATAGQTWSWTELVDLVGEDFAAQLGAKPDGNVNADEDLEGLHAGRNILRASPLALPARATFESRSKLISARAARAQTVVKTIATAGAHGLMLHAMQRAGDELQDLDFGAYAIAIQATLKRDFGVGTEFFSRIARTEIAPTPEDYVLVALGMNDAALAARADQLFFDDEFALYYATADEVLGTRPVWWQPTSGDLPAPSVWRLLLDHAPAGLAAEVAAPFDNPDVPPPGAVLLALQHTLTE